MEYVILAILGLIILNGVLVLARLEKCEREDLNKDKQEYRR